MNQENIKKVRIEWEKPSLVILEISLTEFECLKFGDFNDSEDVACNHSS